MLRYFRPQRGKQRKPPDQPYSERKGPEFNEENLRELVEGNYRVVYRIPKHAIYVQAVWHVRQNLEK